MWHNYLTVGLGSLDKNKAYVFVALAIAVVTIGGHAFRVARTNPVFALRYE